MAKVSTQQNAFNAGELSPLILGRQDLEKYGSGLATCFNAVTLVQGGWTRRGGSVFFKETKFGDARQSRLIPFQFSVSQSYMLEFGHLYVRFFTNGGVLVNTAQTIEDITAADPGVVTITGHGYSDGDRLLISDPGGVTQLLNREVIVSNKTANTFEIQDIDGNDIDTSSFDAYSSGGSLAEIFELTTTYTEDDVGDLEYEQTADDLYLFHTDFHTAILSRVAPLTWTLTDVSFVDGPYLPLNPTATTLDPSGTSGSVTVVASSTTGINNGDGFKSTDVGRLIRFNDGTSWSWMEITAFTSTTQVTATIQGVTLSTHSPQVTWRLGLYSDTTGWPTNGKFHEDRLFLAGVETVDQRIDGSRPALYSEFTPSDPDGTVADDHAISFNMATGQIHPVLWMEVTEKGMLVGTNSGEWIVRPSTLAEALTPSNVTAQLTSSFGSEPVKPIKQGGAILYVQRSGRRLRELAYVFQQDGFQSPDMTVLAEHISRPQLTELSFQQNPQTIVWGIRSDGRLIGFTYDRGQNVLSWHEHLISGPGDASSGDVIVESIATIPSDDTIDDDVYLIMKRFINGRATRHIEFLSKIWEDKDLQENAVHFDCATTVVESPAVSEVTGLWYLEGETLGVWADGTVHPDVTVSNGKVTLDSTYSTITLGYKFNSDGELLPFDAGAQDGSSQGKKKRITRIGFWLMDTLGLKFGKDSSNLKEILFRRWGAEWGTQTAVFTGVVRERFESNTDRLGQVYFRADTGAPATVLSAMLQGDTRDDT